MKNRADLVLFWGADPLATHPRHLERYAAEPAGLFVPRGRADRIRKRTTHITVVVDDGEEI